MPRILLLDDEPLIAMMMQGWLTELDCEIVGPVHSVRSALMLLDGLDGVALDGAILDLSLGNNEKSYAVASVLRDRGIPYAFATGYEAADVDPRFRDALVLSKPFEFEAVRAAIGTLLNPGTMPQSANTR
jgi:CheY-like chemotaxis protein